ncbi:hypothetical protein SALBM311S_03530 [Streptomyces alboniger]
MTDSLLSRRSLMRYGAYGAGAAALAGVAAGWDRLTGADIPGRDDGSLVIATLGSAFNPEAQRALRDGFREVHPDIRIRINPVQAYDWSDFFSKILTQIAAGTAPDLVYVATEGVQLFAQRLGVPLDRWAKRDEAELRTYFADVHPSLVESMMYEGSLHQLPVEFNAADMYLNSRVLERAGADLPDDDWTHDDFTTLLRAMKRSNGDRFTPYFWTNRLWGGGVPGSSPTAPTSSPSPRPPAATGSGTPSIPRHSGAAGAAATGGRHPWPTPTASRRSTTTSPPSSRRICAPGRRAATAATSSVSSPPAASVSRPRAASGRGSA